MPMAHNGLTAFSSVNDCSANDNGPAKLATISYTELHLGGEGRIRTSEGFAGRFTVCSLWPLGNLSTITPFQKQSPFGKTSNNIAESARQSKNLSFT
jgi:hypothetical protein